MLILFLYQLLFSYHKGYYLDMKCCNSFDPQLYRLTVIATRQRELAEVYYGYSCNAYIWKN